MLFSSLDILLLVKMIRNYIVVFLILLSGILSFSIVGQVKADEYVLFEDDFEKYTMGSFPSSGGWTLAYSGAGSTYQIIVDDVYSSPIHSLQLLGDHSMNWGAYAVQRIQMDSALIGFSVKVNVAELGGNLEGGSWSDLVRVGFYQIKSERIITTYSPILFSNNGVIKGITEEFQSFVPEKWYEIEIILDRIDETYCIWIDGELVGEDLEVFTNRGTSISLESNELWNIDGFCVSQVYYDTKAYFDDVKVFSIIDFNPKLDLQPTEGISQTTIQASGFAPNSDVIVTWNEIKMYTIPNPLTTDGYGNFTAMVSILNQTENGKYQIIVSDNMENTASAEFTVIPEFPSWTVLPLFLVASLTVTLYKKKINR